MTTPNRLRYEARHLEALGKDLYWQAEELLERARLVNVDAARLREQADEMEAAMRDVAEVSRLHGQPVELLEAS